MPNHKDDELEWFKKGIAAMSQALTKVYNNQSDNLFIANLHWRLMEQANTGEIGPLKNESNS